MTPPNPEAMAQLMRDAEIDYCIERDGGNKKDYMRHSEVFDYLQRRNHYIAARVLESVAVWCEEMEARDA